MNYTNFKYTIIGIFIILFITASLTQIKWKQELEDIRLGNYTSLSRNFGSLKQENHQTNFWSLGPDGRLVTKTILSQEQLEFQKKQGCMQPCHNNF